MDPCGARWPRPPLWRWVCGGTRRDQDRQARPFRFGECKFPAYAARSPHAMKHIVSRWTPGEDLVIPSVSRSTCRQGRARQSYAHNWKTSYNHDTQPAPGAGLPPSDGLPSTLVSFRYHATRIFCMCLVANCQWDMFGRSGSSAFLQRRRNTPPNAWILVRDARDDGSFPFEPSSLIAQPKAH